MGAKMAKLVAAVALAVLASTGYALLTPSIGEAVTVLCPSDTLSNYLEFFGGSTGCTIGDKTFSFFDVILPFNLSSSQINVTPVDINTSNPGLKFSSTHWNVAGSDITQETDFFYNVQVSPTGAKIKDTSVSLSGEKLSITSDVSLEKFADSGTQHLDLCCAETNDPTENVFSGNFNPAVSLVSAEDDLILSTGSDGSASLDSFTQHWSEVTATVPEPASFALMGTALFGLGWRRRMGR